MHDFEHFLNEFIKIVFFLCKRAGKILPHGHTQRDF